MNDQLQTKKDLIEDLIELKYLFRDYLNKLAQFNRDLNRSKGLINSANFNLINENTKSLFINIEKNLISIVNLIKSGSSSKILRINKYKFQDILRTVAVLCSNLIVSTDWQSPSYLHSISSKAGLQNGKITGTINDYKRDVHLDSQSYEEMFLKENITARSKFFLKSYLVSSGMAAFQTILTYLLSEKKIKGKILTGQNSYFQYKQILNGAFGTKIIETDELSTDDIISLIRNEQISAIFLDSLCNSPQLPEPDLKKIMEFLYKSAGSEIYLIIDNTCLSVFFQPFLLRGRNHRVHLIQFESLNKYNQFGLDRVTAGIIVCENSDAGGIFEYRKHAGTNITDGSAHVLPSPNRKLLEARLIRHQRNVRELSLFLSEKINSYKNTKVEKIICPGNNANEAGNRKFYGSFMNIALKNKFDRPEYMKKLMTKVLSEAKKNQVNIVAGTSFGLNTTRIYLTSLWNKSGKPFLRLSAGTEDILEVNLIKISIWEAIRKF